MTHRRIALLCATAVATITTGATATAQQDPAEPAANSTEIIVTAQRRAESLQNVPVSVGVVGGDVLQQQSLTSLEAVSSRQTTVVIRPAPGGDQIAIRGTSSGFNPGFEQSVATFVDGVYRPRARSSRAALFDVERVEILKGPQTTYFGANAIAGALNITTRRPKDEFGANMLAYYSPDLDEYNLEAGLDFPVSHRFGLRLAGRLAGMDAITRNGRLDKRGEQETRQFRISGRGDLSDAIRVDARFDYVRTRHTGDAALEIVDCPPKDLPASGQCAAALAQLGSFDNRLDRYNATGFMDRFYLDLYEGMVSTTIDLGGPELVATSAYQHQKAGITIDNINMPINSPLGVSALIPSQVNENFSQFSQEVRLQSSGSGPFNYMIGGYYERSRTKVFSGTGYFQARFGALVPAYFSPDDLIVQITRTNQLSKTWSGFATASYDVTPELKASVGLRYSSVTKDAVRDAVYGTLEPFAPGATPDLSRGFTPGPAAGQAALAGLLGISLSPYPISHRKDSEWMPSANISYKITPDIMTYASYVHAFKAGGYNLQVGLDTFGPEKADSYELGIKAAWFDRRLTTNLTFFLTDYGNLQEAGNLFTSTGVPIPFVGNVAASRAKGVELEVNAAIADGFTMRGSLGYLQSKYRDYPNAPCSPYQTALGMTCPQPNMAGATRFNSPRWSGNVAADYRTALSSDLDMTLGASLYFRSKYFLQTIPEDITAQSGFAKVDLRASVGSSERGWNLAIIAKNVFNRLTATFAGHAPTAPGTTQWIADRGRSVGLQLTMNFGSSR
ncbi:MAG: TonB-dependent receptor [Sphingobium sp.]